MSRPFITLFLLACVSISSSPTRKSIIIKSSLNEDYFTTNISIGSPAQTFDVQIDTTTSETWVPSSNNNKPIILSNNATYGYNTSLSSTGRNTNMTIEIADEDGDVSGKLTFDSFDLDGLSLTNFGFVQVTEYDEEFADHKEGKLGLGYRHEHGADLSFLEQLKSQGVIQKKIFSMKVSDDNTGVLQIGDLPSNYDNSSYTFCNLTTTEGLSDEYRSGWVCEISHVLINNTWESSIEISGRAIFDSAYSFISAPNQYKEVLKEKFLQNHFKSACAEVKDDNDDLSIICPKRNLENVTLGIVLDGYSYVLSGEDLFHNLGGDKMEFLIKFYGDEDIWTLGHPFVSLFTVIYNAEDNQVGFLGGERVDFTEEWSEWDLGASLVLEQNRSFLLMVGGGVLGVILLIVIIFLVIHSLKRRRLDQHGPLINERN